MSKAKNATKIIVLIALLTATLTGGKFALSSIPNVEIVTLLIMVYTVVFGLKISLPTVLIFVTLEIFIFPINTWVVSYYVYWPMLAIITWLCVKLIEKNKYLFPAIIAGVMTLFFGVLTSFVDACFYAGGEEILSMFVAIYVKGVTFFIIHFISNVIVLAVAFVPLTKLLTKLKERFFVNN